MNRRRLLKATAGFAVMGLAMPNRAVAANTLLQQTVRGSVSAQEFGIVPDTTGNQAGAFSALLERASTDDLPIFLPPGRYVLSHVTLPPRVRLSGVPGATRLTHGGGGAFFRAVEAEHLALNGLVLDGAHIPLLEAQALLEVRGARKITLDDCTILNSGGSGIVLENAAGRVTDTEISSAADYGLYTLDANRLDISGNTVTDCGNGGILVHRSQIGEDGTSVMGNRIARIRADQGGTGQYGNGINAYQAANVSVADNHISDCAFSAIRGNSASNFKVTANTCLNSGETALYAEFAFEGAVISANIIDGAANGISMVNFDNGGRMCTCSGNIVRNLSPEGPYPSPLIGFGVGINAEADAAISGNLIERAPLHGMRIGWGEYLRNVAVTGNVTRETGTGIAVSVVEGTGSVTITGNVISDSRNGAVVGYRWGDAVTEDLAISGSDDFPHLTVKDNQVA